MPDRPFEGQRHIVLATDVRIGGLFSLCFVYANVFITHLSLDFLSEFNIVEISNQTKTSYRHLHIFHESIRFLSDKY